MKSERSVAFLFVLCLAKGSIEIFLLHNSVTELVSERIAFAVLKAMLIFGNYFLGETEVYSSRDS